MRKEMTAFLIEEMKKQTIGVEIEMNNITRKKAAIVAANYFGTGKYDDTAYINGYYTWSAWDLQGREWKFMRDVSINGIDDEKCELVTPILHYEDIEFLQELVRRLRKAGAKSCPQRGCGVHIHIGADGHDAKTLRNLVNLMASHEELIGNSIWLGTYRKSTYCKPVNPNFLKMINKVKPQTMDELKDVWYKGNNAEYGIEHHYNESRYHMLNLHATFTKGTVEFRLFQFDNPTHTRKGGLHAGQLKAYIQLCLAMSCKAKFMKNASAKPQKTINENPKYAMRGWLVALGMSGDEFETARKILTEKLKGSSNLVHNQDVA